MSNEPNQDPNEAPVQHPDESNEDFQRRQQDYEQRRGQTQS